MRQKRGLGTKGHGALIFGAGNAPLLHRSLESLQHVPDAALTEALSKVDVALLCKVDLTVWRSILDRVDALVANHVEANIPPQLRLEGEADEACLGSEHTPDCAELEVLLRFLTRLLEDSSNRLTQPP